MPILGAGELNLFVLLVKRKYNIGNKYFLVKWESILYVGFLVMSYGSKHGGHEIYLIIYLETIKKQSHTEKLFG
jgi:hypothetical protein